MLLSYPTSIARHVVDLGSLAGVVLSCGWIFPRSSLILT